MLSVVFYLLLCWMLWHYAHRSYAECCLAECCYADSRYADFSYADCCYAACRNSECHYGVSERFETVWQNQTL